LRTISFATPHIESLTYFWPVAAAGRRRRLDHDPGPQRPHDLRSRGSSSPVNDEIRF
jgi:hypothetical protein